MAQSFSGDQMQAMMTLMKSEIQAMMTLMKSEIQAMIQAAIQPLIQRLDIEANAALSNNKLTVAHKVIDFNIRFCQYNSKSTFDEW